MAARLLATGVLPVLLYLSGFAPPQPKQTGFDPNTASKKACAVTHSASRYVGYRTDRKIPGSSLVLKLEETPWIKFCDFPIAQNAAAR